MFIECSARTGDNVKQLFRNLATALPGSVQPAAGGASGGAGRGGIANAPYAPESNLIDIKLSAVPPGGEGEGAARTSTCCS